MAILLFTFQLPMICALANLSLLGARAPPPQPRRAAAGPLHPAQCCQLETCLQAFNDRCH